MENQDFDIGIKTIWFVLIGNVLFPIVGAFAKIEHWEYSPVLPVVYFIK